MTAIHNALDDGNPATAPDTTWSPLFTTPAHPEYPSGHSCLCGATAAVLADEFGERARFGVVRSFSGPSAALEEVKNARILPVSISARHVTSARDWAATSPASHENMFQRLD